MRITSYFIALNDTFIYYAVNVYEYLQLVSVAVLCICLANATHIHNDKTINKMVDFMISASNFKLPWLNVSCNQQAIRTTA